MGPRSQEMAQRGWARNGAGPAWRSRMRNQRGASFWTVRARVRATAGSLPERPSRTRVRSVGLETTDAPGACVAEGAVVEVHGVLRREDEADTEGARLLHEGNQRALGGRVRG